MSDTNSPEPKNPSNKRGSVLSLPPKPVVKGERIAKKMARAGLCSRRDAENWIEDGRVKVNGVILTSPAVNVLPSDEVVVDGVVLHAPEPTRLFLFHKPRGTVTTDRDPEGRSTIFDVLPEDLPRLMSIGRLDINTEGLLLLTNDGGLARVLELPKTGWLRRYRVRAHGEITQPQLDALRGGITIDGVSYAGIEAILDRAQGANMWLTMGLREGKNREIKRVLEHLGLAVNRLIRLSFGPFQLLDLPEGAIEEVKTRVLREQLGEALIAEAGCFFDESGAAGGPGKSGRAMPERAMAERAGAARRFKPEQDFSATPEDDEGGPRRRKHVKTLRAQREVQSQTGPRQKVTSGTTHDRRGREVPVDRVERVRRPRPIEDEASAMRDGSVTREKYPARDAVREQGRTSGAGDRPARKSGPRGPRRSEDGYDERPRTGRSFEKRQLSSRSFKADADIRPNADKGRGRFGSERAGDERAPERKGPRKDGFAGKRAGTGFAGRSARAEGAQDGRPPQRERRPAPRGFDGDDAFKGRGAGKDAARSQARPRFEKDARSDKSPRFEKDTRFDKGPRDGAKGAGKRPGGRPGSDRPGSDRPGSGKPGSDRPRGGRPMRGR